MALQAGGPRFLRWCRMTLACLTLCPRIGLDYPAEAITALHFTK